jgi:hypothetical protein
MLLDFGKRKVSFASLYGCVMAAVGRDADFLFYAVIKWYELVL